LAYLPLKTQIILWPLASRWRGDYLWSTGPLPVPGKVECRLAKKEKLHSRVHLRHNELINQGAAARSVARKVGAAVSAAPAWRGAGVRLII